MRTSRSRTLATAGVASLLALSACGGGDDVESVGTQPTDTQPTGTTAADTTAADTTAADDRATITIADFAFDGVTEIPVGTTVVVTNTDDAQHTWTALDGTFDSGALGKGDSFELTFTEAGSFDYRCNFHPSMTGTIVVTG